MKSFFDSFKRFSMKNINSEANAEKSHHVMQNHTTPQTTKGKNSLVFMYPITRKFM